MNHGIESSALSDALVILGAAGIVIPLFARFRITPVIGFILVGVLVGPSGLGALTERVPWLVHVTISDREAIEPFAEFGIVLLLFSIGLELSFKRLWAMRGMVFGVGAAELIGCGLLIGGALLALGQSPIGALGMGLALALSSTALVLPMSGTKTPVGKAALGILLFQDVAIVPIIFFIGAMGPMAQDAGLSALGWTLLLSLVTVAGLLVGGRLILPRLFAQAARTKSPEVFLAACLLVIILASLSTSAVGLSPIVGALVAGLVIAETEYHREVEVITEPFKGLALGVFLITVGMSLDLPVVMDNWTSLLLAVVGVVLVKTVVISLLLRFAGARRATSAEAGLLMSSPSETTLIVLTAALQAALIQPSTAAFWQTVTAIGLTITPLLARAGRIAARRVEMRETHVDLSGENGEADERAIIVGFGRVGRLIAEMLLEHDQAFVAVDSNIDTVARGRRDGFPTIFGDVSRPQLLENLDLERVSALILTMDDPVSVVQLTARVREAHPDLTIVARARDPEHAAALYRAGATDAVPETVESSLQLSEAVLVDIGVPMGPVIASVHEKRADLREAIMQLGELDRLPELPREKLRKS
ncbi:cation:proton antiporter [Parasphingopyxis lamellibrachiae]|uniref:Kef-type potassium/proton antiporter (CPA2 family) n=1 Tax=Parasphingopyxis lamellibrachiae TaxID=680125 RepID=A0A3D9FCT9_9SPHN|nr:cation:proton antiporter [Parasphingopyxis lamellibrachiae]RED15609.1 Kef-type potassium/proton antiporter (CPA2 family) [Parasphingopyxis lamellibrachiae]